MHFYVDCRFYLEAHQRTLPQTAVELDMGQIKSKAVKQRQIISMSRKSGGIRMHYMLGISAARNRVPRREYGGIEGGKEEADKKQRRKGGASARRP